MNFGISKVERQTTELVNSILMSLHTSFRENVFIKTRVGAFSGVFRSDTGVGKASPLNQLSILVDAANGGN